MTSRLIDPSRQQGTRTDPMPTTQSDTTMAAAFAKAGYEAPEKHAEKLRRLMAKAIGKPGDPGAGLREPSMLRFQALLLNEEDAELVWSLFEAVRAGVVGKLFDEVLPDVRAGKEFGLGDRRIAEPHGKIESQSGGGAAGETRNDVQSGGRMSQPAAAVTSVTTIGRPQHAPPGGGINGMLMVVHHQRQSWLRRFTVGNKPVGSMTIAELDDAIRRTGQGHRYLKLLQEEIPPYVNGGLVGDYITDDRADRLYERATELPDAA